MVYLSFQKTSHSQRLMQTMVVSMCMKSVKMRKSEIRFHRKNQCYSSVNRFFIFKPNQTETIFSFFLLQTKLFFKLITKTKECGNDWEK